MTTIDHGILGEDLQVPERLIAAPAAGVFRLLPSEAEPESDADTDEGQMVQTGQVMGSIERNAGAIEVVSPHTGFLMGLLALPGERVRDGQPLAWVRVIG